jgi:NAD(P)H dehydrogenase (quinone)
VNAYVVYCHPDPGSFTAALRDRAVDSLKAAGHRVRVSDLYADGFEPTMSPDEWLHYLDPPADQPEIEPYRDNLRWCDALVFIYPTWWSGQPAMLTGWFDRVLVRGGRLTNVRRLVAITSHGSSKFLNVIEGETGRGIITRTVRALCHRYTRTTWLAMYNLDRSSEAQRVAFLDRVQRRMGDLWPAPTTIAVGRKW